MNSLYLFFRTMREVGAGILLLGTSVVACYAANTIVNFEGHIIAGTCTITTELNQVVELGDTSVTYFATQGDVSPAKPFSIIVNCPVGGPEKATVMFSGNVAVNTDLLALDEGGATGVAVRINEDNGELIKPGTESASMILTEGESILKFNAQYQSLVERSAITPGSANATAQFTINYQ